MKGWPIREVEPPHADVPHTKELSEGSTFLVMTLFGWMEGTVGSYAEKPAIITGRVAWILQKGDEFWENAGGINMNMVPPPGF